MNRPIPDIIESQLRLACQEVRDLVTAGNRNAAARVLSAYPGLVHDPEQLIEVLFTEFVACEECGIPVDVAELLKSYSFLKDRFHRLLEIHRSLGDDEPAADTRAILRSSHTHTPGTSSSMPSASIPQQESRYCDLIQIGEGGMGVIYKVHDTLLNRTVALKRLQRSGQNSPQLVREAAATAKLQHPNVVQIFDVGVSDEGPFLTMEWIDGNNLEQSSLHNTLTGREAAQLLVKLADATQSAHDVGIIHRDLKPANVLLSSSGEPKIVDFGLAKILSTEALPQNQRHSHSGAMLGTPAYMSPEQVRQDTVGRATDVYGLGGILYETLTGRPPFRNASTAELFHNILEIDPVSPRTLQPNLDRDLDTICMKCLAKAAHDRYASAAELRDELQRFLNGQPILARPVGLATRTYRWCGRNRLVASLIAVVILTMLTGLAGVTWQWKKAQQQSAVAAYHADQAIQQKHHADQQRHTAEQQRELAVTERKRAEANFAAAKSVVEQFTDVGAELTRSPGTELLGRKTLEDALQFYQQILDLKGDHVRTQYETARAHHRVARIQNDLGRWSEAEAASDHAINLFTSLHQNAPHNYSYGFWLLESHCQRSFAIRGTGRIDDTKDAFTLAKSIGTKLVQAFPDKPRLKSLLSIVIMNWQNAIDPKRDNITGLEQAVALQREVVQSDPNGQWPRQDLAHGLNDMAMAEHGRGNSQQAEKMLRDAIAIQDDISRNYPHQIAHRFFLARSHGHLGLVLFDQRNFQESCDHLESSILIARELCQQKPHVVSYVAQLAEGHWALCKTRFQIDVNRSVVEFEAAMKEFARLVQHWPEQDQFKARVLDILRKMVKSTYGDSSAHDIFSPIYRTWIAEFTQACLVERGSPEQNLVLANSLVTAAWVARRCERNDIAIMAYERQSTIIAALPPELRDADAQRQSIELAKVLLMMTHLAQGNREDAVQLMQVDFAQRPDSIRGCNSLAWFLLTCSDNSLRDPERAWRLATISTDADPDNANFWNTRALAAYRCGKFLEAISATAKAQSLGSVDPTDFFIRSAAEFKNGNADAAKQYLEAGERKTRTPQLDAVWPKLFEEVRQLIHPLTN